MVQFVCTVRMLLTGRQEPATKELPATHKPKLFDARLVCNESGDMIRPLSYPDYVGEPSSDLEAAWEDTLPGKDTSLEIPNARARPELARI